MKLWDVRKIKTPLNVFENLPNHAADTSCLFSPDKKVIVTGTSAKSGGSGHVVFYNAKTFEKIRSIAIADTSVVSLNWHPKLNQIFVGGADGAIRVMYNPIYSLNGALLCANRSIRKAHPADFVQHLNIINPHSLPMYKDNSHQLKKQRYDAKSTKKPSQPKTTTPGLGVGGELASRNLTQHWMKMLTTKKQMIKKQDPREEILKYKDVAQDDPMYFGRAYQDSNPQGNILVPILSSGDEEEEMTEFERKLRNERPA